VTAFQVSDFQSVAHSGPGLSAVYPPSRGTNAGTREPALAATQATSTPGHAIDSSLPLTVPGDELATRQARIKPLARAPAIAL